MFNKVNVWRWKVGGYRFEFFKNVSVTIPIFSPESYIWGQYILCWWFLFCVLHRQVRCFSIQNITFDIGLSHFQRKSIWDCVKLKCHANMIWEYSQFWSQLLLFSPLICVCVSIMVQIKDQKIKSLFSLVWNQNESTFGSRTRFRHTNTFSLPSLFYLILLS